MEASEELIKSVKDLLQHGYRCQVLYSDFAVLAKPNTKVTTVSADGKVSTLPLSEFLETILNG